MMFVQEACIFILQFCECFLEAPKIKVWNGKVEEWKVQRKMCGVEHQQRCGNHFVQRPSKSRNSVTLLSFFIVTLNLHFNSIQRKLIVPKEKRKEETAERWRRCGVQIGIDFKLIFLFSERSCKVRTLLSAFVTSLFFFTFHHAEICNTSLPQIS